LEHDFFAKPFTLWRIVCPAGLGISFIVRDKESHRKRLFTLLVLAPVMVGCSSMPDLFQSDLLSKDAEWFSRTGRILSKNVSIEAPPLTPDKPVLPGDLVSADGGCPGMPAAGGPVDANASTGGSTAPAPSTTGTVALGHTECDVVRGIGVPDSVNLSNNSRGDRVAMISYSHGQRAGIYTFTSGRLTSIERGAEPVEQPPKAAKSKSKKPTAT
jgi:hypothetical protein